MIICEANNEPNKRHYSNVKQLDLRLYKSSYILRILSCFTITGMASIAHKTSKWLAINKYQAFQC